MLGSDFRILKNNLFMVQQSFFQVYNKHLSKLTMGIYDFFHIHIILSHNLLKNQNQKISHKQIFDFIHRLDFKNFILY